MVIPVDQLIPSSSVFAGFERVSQSVASFLANARALTPREKP
jgi:hypothetical protein